MLMLGLKKLLSKKGLHQPQPGCSTSSEHSGFHQLQSGCPADSEHLPFAPRPQPALDGGSCIHATCASTGADASSLNPGKTGNAFPRPDGRDGSCSAQKANLEDLECGSHSSGSARSGSDAVAKMLHAAAAAPAGPPRWQAQSVPQGSDGRVLGFDMVPAVAGLTAPATAPPPRALAGLGPSTTGVEDFMSADGQERIPSERYNDHYLALRIEASAQAAFASISGGSDTGSDGAEGMLPTTSLTDFEPHFANSYGPVPDGKRPPALAAPMPRHLHLPAKYDSPDTASHGHHGSHDANLGHMSNKRALAALCHGAPALEAPPRISVQERLQSLALATGQYAAAEMWESAARRRRQGSCGGIADVGPPVRALGGDLAEVEAEEERQQQQEQQVQVQQQHVRPQELTGKVGQRHARCLPREDGLLFLSPAAPQPLLLPGPWDMDRYSIVRQLYQGYASHVYKAMCPRSEAECVLKAYDMSGLSPFISNQILRELDIHSRIQHSSIVQLFAAFKEGGVLVLVQEYVRGGSLDRVRCKLGGRMTEFQAMHLVLLPLLNALVYLHGRGIVHRDIKPENVLLTEEWELKLCDFGVSICLHEERAVTKTGSKEYMAPEVMVCPLKRGADDNKHNEQLAYTPAVDVWSVGALMYELLVGFTPFPAGPPKALGVVGPGAAAAAPAMQLSFPASVGEGARALIRDCLQLEPVDRPTVHQLLQHPWVHEALDDAAEQL